MSAPEAGTIETIKHLDLGRQLEAIRPEIDSAIANILDNTAFVGGKPVSDFEDAYAEFCGSECCIGVGNGTDAIYLTLWALMEMGKLKRGDEVITSAMSFIATIEPLYQLGLKPVLVDIDDATYNLDPKKVADAVTDKTRMIIPVHLYGQPCDMDELMSIAEKNNLLVLEDSAQAHGATYAGKHVGNFGASGTFSFYPGKNLGAFGDGGAVITNDEILAKKIRMISNHGRTKKYEHDMMGINSRLDTLQAAILSVKLNHISRWNEGRQKIAARYNDALKNIDGLKLPALGDNRTHVFHQYVVCLDDREGFQAHCEKFGVQTGIHYPIPLHLQPACKELGYQQGQFPNAEKLGEQCVSLPIYAEMTDNEIERVIDTVRRYFSA